MSKITLTRDDLTGKEIPEAGKPVTVTFNGAKYELDLSDISVKAVTALLSEPGKGLDSMLTVYQEAGLRLVDQGPVKPARASRSRSGSGNAAGKDGGRNARAREWGLSTDAGRKAARAAYPDRAADSPLPERGRLSPDFLAAYDAHESASPNGTASPAPQVSPVTGKTA